MGIGVRMSYGDDLRITGHVSEYESWKEHLIAKLIILHYNIIDIDLI